MKSFRLNVGMCIYCGDRTSPLTREHVLPRGLGGNDAPEGLSNALILREASCQACQKVTQKIEEDCLVSMMGPGRARLGLRRKDRASAVTTAHIDLLDGASEQRDVPWEAVPAAIAIPSFYEAPILSGEPVPNFAPCDYEFRVLEPARLPVDGTRRIGVALKADSRMFARMLGKIGLGLAVSCLGLDGYVPLVRSLIVKGSNPLGLVGGYAGTSRTRPQTSSLHTLSLITNGGASGSLILAEICLFAEFFAPTNYVAIGRWL